MAEPNVNMWLYEAVRSVPKEAKKEIGAGRLKGMTDVNPMWRIKTLTEQFGPAGDGWWTDNETYTVLDGSGGEKVVRCDLKMYVKFPDGTISKGIFGTGGSKLVANEKSGPYTDDESFKKAYTDAISVACKALGVAADVYYAKDTTKYSTYEEAPQTAQKQPQTGKKPKAENSPTEPPTGETGGNNDFEQALNYKVTLKGKEYRLGDLKEVTLNWLEERADDELKRLINKVFAYRMQNGQDGDIPF